MPLTKNVPSLYYMALDVVFEQLYEFLHYDERQSEFKKIQKFCMEIIPFNIRQHLINMCVSKDRNRIEYVLEFIHLLADGNIKHLRPNINNGFMLVSHYEKLMKYLTENNCVALRTLRLKIISDMQMHQVVDPGYDMRTCNYSFERLLSKGMGDHLCELYLSSVCNDHLLFVIGRLCKQLTLLDISQSWSVSDYGIKNLCLRESKFQPVGQVKELRTLVKEIVHNSADVELNDCCYTLKCLKIQGTNTTSTSLHISLICLHELRTLGGFLFQKNVGDIIVRLSQMAKEAEDVELKFNLREIYDVFLPLQKALIVASLVPNVQRIYTRAEYLWPLDDPFNNLTALTIDFDSYNFNVNSEPIFWAYVENYGYKLKALTLIDQPLYFSIYKIAQYCPNLEMLSGCLNIGSDEYVRTCTAPFLKNLTITNLVLNHSDTFLWLLRNAPKLTHCEAYFNPFFQNNPIYTEVSRTLIKDILNSDADCLDTIKCLNIALPEPYTVSVKVMKRLLKRCPQLSHMGNFAAFRMPARAYAKLLKEIKQNNWEVSLFFGHNAVGFA